MLITNVKETLANCEAECWQYVQELRKINFRGCVKGVRKPANAIEATIQGATVALEIIDRLGEQGLDFETADPGHGVGHFARDYVHALMLFSRLAADPSDAFIGFVAGVCHDLGCCVVPRYAEANHAVRHAEACALVLRQLFDANPCGLNEAEQRLVEYSVASHTHYLRPANLTCADGEKRLVEPWLDADDNSPFWPVWFTRWVDRLDTNGPFFPGRHFLTLYKVHEDFDGKSHFSVEFSAHMRPLLRTKEERGNDAQTMLEHMEMFVQSQNSDSPYGKHDYGEMQVLRDGQSDDLKRIIQCVLAMTDERHHVGYALSPSGGISLLNDWFAKCVEPSRKGREVARALLGQLLREDKKTTLSWLFAFLRAMELSEGWSRRVLNWQISMYSETPKIPDKLMLLSGEPQPQPGSLASRLCHYAESIIQVDIR